MGKLKQVQMVKTAAALKNELAHSIKSIAEARWNHKIKKGIIPYEVEEKYQGHVDLTHHRREMSRLAQFEAGMAFDLFYSLWKPKEPHKELHYFGIGTGEALALVARIANDFEQDVVAYDTCQAGVDNGNLAFHQTNGNNHAYLADICFASRPRYIHPEKARWLIASRVIDVLDKQEPGWEKKKPGLRKGSRTLFRLGRLLPYLQIMLIQRLPEDNVNTDIKWHDSSPHTFEQIVACLEKGARSKVEAKKLGQVIYHGHVHTAMNFRLA